MKREIKFRGWNIEMKQMVFPSIEFGRNIWPCTYKEITETKEEKGKKVVIVTELVSVDHILQEEHCYDVMQFTGLQDKNGKDIYEGDIAREWLVDTVEPEGGFWNYYEIKFEKGCFVCKEIGFTYEKEGPPNLHECSNEIAIIGNIYENPELLNSQK